MSVVYVYDSKTDTFVEEDDFRSRTESFPEKSESQIQRPRMHSHGSFAKTTLLKNRLQVKNFEHNSSKEMTICRIDKLQQFALSIKSLNLKASVIFFVKSICIFLQLIGAANLKR